MLPALDDEDDQDEDDQPDAADLDEDADMQIAPEDLEEQPEESNGERSVESPAKSPVQVVASENPNQINSQQEFAGQFLRQSPQK